MLFGRSHLGMMVPSGFGWDITGFSYASKNLNHSVKAYAVRGIAFGDSGSKLYLMDAAGPSVTYQYSVSTPYDISTAIDASKSFSSFAEATGARGFAISLDGTKAYVGDATTDKIFQYTLSSAWDISTASYASKSLSITTEDSNGPTCFDFSDDGETLYVIGATNNVIFQYALSTAWDISTASYDSKSFSVNSQETNAAGMFIGSRVLSDDKLFIVGSTNDTVYQYTLLTPGDISSASYDSVSVSVNSEDTTPRGITFNNDGSIFYIAGNTNDKVFQYEL